MPQNPTHQEIAFQQVMVEDSSVFSIQWSIFPGVPAAALSPEKLLNRYLEYVRVFTGSIIRPQKINGGIEFRLLGTVWSLISFLPPVKETAVLSLHLCGGILVQPCRCSRGEFRFGVEQGADGTRITLQLSDFYPLILGGPSPSRIRFWLYRLTQAAIHRMVTIRFLALLYRDLTGSSVDVRVVNVSVRHGKPV
jgi:hypothetical protein